MRSPSIRSARRLNQIVADRPRGASDVLAAVFAQLAFAVAPAHADVGGLVQQPGAPPVLRLLNGAVDSLDLGPEDVGACLLARVVEVRQQAAQQLQLLLFPL